MYGSGSADIAAEVRPAVAGTAQDAAKSDVPPARDGRVAVYEEFLLAQRAATIAAWDLFLARHPRSELAVAARAERARLEALGR